MPRAALPAPGNILLENVSVPTVTLGSLFNVGFAKSAQPLAPGPGYRQRWVHSPKIGGIWWSCWCTASVVRYAWRWSWYGVCAWGRQPTLSFGQINVSHKCAMWFNKKGTHIHAHTYTHTRADTYTVTLACTYNFLVYRNQMYQTDTVVAYIL